MVEDVETFIKHCLTEGRIYWTYHVNMRIRERDFVRSEILDALSCCQVIEEYPSDSPLPSYLVLCTGFLGKVFHSIVALDEINENIRIITVYRPAIEKWSADFRSRR
ncbi:MAG: DUF4258 domain-containing protein [Candidatus Wallbacteria bacterium]|nr:DUF4258 domain-containing protein [Candidatus Wallbacteria bacterium]